MATRSIDREVDRRRAEIIDARSTRKLEILSMEESFARDLERQVLDTTTLRWPNPLYQRDPLGFFYHILGIDPWERQAQIIDDIGRNDRVAIKSGHKVSKSNTASGMALWFYCSWEKARVVMTSTTDRQVNQILWRELRMMVAESGKCVDCKRADPYDQEIPRPCPHSAMIDGQLGDLARTGLKSANFREIVGFTAREAEAVAGISGANLFYIIDEASGIPAIIFEAIEGNRAGGAKVVMFSNPTKTTGEFFDAFHRKKKFYSTHSISSEETPNVKAGKKIIPGLATVEWVEEKKEEHGEDSAWYRVRVKGEFPLNEDGKIFSIHSIKKANDDWHDTEGSGRLFIGCDPAGDSGTNNESAFVPRRGFKIYEILTELGLTPEAHIVRLLDLIAEYGNPNKGYDREVYGKPVVVLDRDGTLGAKVYSTMLGFLSTIKDPPFELVGVRSSDRAIRHPMLYHRVRDDLAGNMLEWMRAGGTYPENAKLEAELHEWEWKEMEGGLLQRWPHKKVVAKILGRSPDSYDGCVLSVWEPLTMRATKPKEPSMTDTVPREPARLTAYTTKRLDPYASASGLHRR